MKSRKFFSTLYTPLLLMTLLVSILGLVNLFSATTNYQNTAISSFFLSQLSYTGIGFILMFLIMRIPSRYLYMGAPFLYFATLVLLALVLVIGEKVNGTLGWLNLGFARVQPSEFAKLGLIFMLSRQLAMVEHRSSFDILELMKPVMIAGLPLVLVLLQKDLGSSLFFGLILLTLTSLQGIRWYLIVIGIVIVVGGGLIAYHHFLLPYQQKRIVSFLNPELDPRGSGYHLVQSKIAVGSGQVWGRGYLHGESNKLKFLPERHTDFIFPVLAEEWGFVGATTMMVSYFFFLLSGFGIASRATNRFGFFLAVGMVSLFFWHMVINLGGVLGLIPLTGVPLPFLSYGGSALFTNWIAIGVLLSIYRSRFTSYKTH